MVEAHVLQKLFSLALASMTGSAWWRRPGQEQQVSAAAEIPHWDRGQFALHFNAKEEREEPDARLEAEEKDMKTREEERFKISPSRNGFSRRLMYVRRGGPQPSWADRSVTFWTILDTPSFA
jgi:hypothetical protein